MTQCEEGMALTQNKKLPHTPLVLISDVLDDKKTAIQMRSNRVGIAERVKSEARWRRSGKQTARPQSTPKVEKADALWMYD